MVLRDQGQGKGGLQKEVGIVIKGQNEGFLRCWVLTGGYVNVHRQ